uniref:GST C-terminal domain-containing protein n=1 Tax=Salix viminalis TaxID=40686 RepID=A0A6N2LLW7_SALVM
MFVLLPLFCCISFPPPHSHFSLSLPVARCSLYFSFGADRIPPPLSVIAAAKVASLTLPPPSTVTSASDSACLPTFLFSNGLKLQGTYVLLRYIGRVANLYGQDPFESSQIDQWLEYTPVLSVGSEFENACNYIDNYLQTRTFLVGYSLSIADIAIWSGLADGRVVGSLRSFQM